MGFSRRALRKLEKFNAHLPEEKRAQYERTSERLSETFRKENMKGAWTLEQLKKMEQQFNAYAAVNEKDRELILFRMLHAREIFQVIVNEFTCVSEYALRIDITSKQFNSLLIGEFNSRNLVPFSDIVFGPADPERKHRKKHDAHVKAFVMQKRPLPYQRRYPDEPKYTVSIELKKNSIDEYELHIQHLVKCGGFCRCVNLRERQLLKAVSLKDIRMIKMEKNSNGSHDLIVFTHNL